MSHDEMIAVITAHRDGKEIEIAAKHVSCYPKWNAVFVPLWNFADCDYRIKPEPPKPREFWLRIGIETKGINTQFDTLNPPQTSEPGHQFIRVREVLPETPL